MIGIFWGFDLKEKIYISQTYEVAVFCVCVGAEVVTTTEYQHIEWREWLKSVQLYIWILTTFLNTKSTVWDYWFI